MCRIRKSKPLALLELVDTSLGDSLLSPLKYGWFPHVYISWVSYIFPVGVGKCSEWPDSGLG